MKDLTLKKTCILIFILLSMGMSCFVLFHFIGFSIDEQGILHEPFVLLPVGWFFIGLGIIALLKLIWILRT